MTSVGGEEKSGEGKIRGIDKTSETKGRTAKEKKEESSKKVTSIEIK